MQRVKGLVAENSLEGFRRSVEALFEYDVREDMKGCQVKGLLVVGAGDGVLPKTMRQMAQGIGSGVDLKVVEGAGHLPMMEQPREFARIVGEFLDSA